MKKMRWGILGAANIARKNWKAIAHSGNSVITAVASRDLERSRRFIAQCQAEEPFEAVPTALGGYGELLASRDVDAVYIPLPTGLRKEWVLRAAAAGKHVLCEKPCGAGLSDVREMTQSCREHGVQFMDGVMFMHNPRMEKLRQALSGPAIGEIRRMSSSFSFRMRPEAFESNVRVNSGLEPAGCLGDLGWYCIRFFLWAMSWQSPREATGRILSQKSSAGSPGPVPVEFSGELIFENGASAAFYCSFTAEHQNWVHVSGANGSMRLADFVHPLSVEEPSFELNGAVVACKCCDGGPEHTGSQAMSQQAIMFRNFSDQVRSGRLNEDWPMWALKTQEVMDACLDSAKNR